MQINSKEKIIEHFKNGIKKDQFIGVENEKFLFFKSKNQRIDYDNIRKILEKFQKKYNWDPINEGQYLIGLKHEGKSISLEPGNQIELAGEKLKNIHLVCSESYTFQDQLKEICDELDIKILSVGYDPVTKLNQVPNNPKQRYKIMTTEMPKNGELSLDMMYNTSGTQINLDYTSENDFIKKFKLVSNLTPLTVALFANSAVKENKPNGYLSYRTKVWQKTSRGGLPNIFLENMDFEKYSDFVINMPLLFLFHNKIHISPNKKKFKDFMEGKIRDIEYRLPETKDLETHLSTIFTELRLKNYLEIRSLDACEWDCHCAGPAFFTGLIYGKLEEALDVIKNWKSNDILNAYLEAPKKGLKTEIENKTILEWGEIFLNISREGLITRNKKNKKGNDETIYLRNVENVIKNKKTKAEITLENTIF